MAPKMEFFNGAQNFTMGNVEFNTTQGNYHDYSVRNVRNTYGDRNRYYTNNNNRYYNNSTNYGGGYHAPATHYHGPVNNVRKANNVGNINGRNVNLGTINGNWNEAPGAEGADSPPSAPSGYDQYRPPPGRRPGPGPPPHDQDWSGPSYDQYPPPPAGRRPGPYPYDEDFTATDSSIPQYQNFSQQRGPPPPDLPYRPHSGPEDYEEWWDQPQQGPPPPFPPRGPQGYPQHPPQNPNYRPSGGPYSAPQQQRQPPPNQQKRWGAEEWPGQRAYEQGMAHLKQNNPPSWGENSSGDSDSSDEDGSTDDETMRKAKRMQDPNRPDRTGMNRGPSQSTSNQFAPQRQPPPAADVDDDDDTGINGPLSSLSLDKTKKKKEPMNSFNSKRN